ncbi:FAD/NAD(P)-binding domain-containing protein [Serendipita vermifera]|nr:FAD/NAD(P)-binding domain-containing protein [Serendipita vermifera]
MDENSFDVCIIGTDLTESIIAAALSKTGLRVLHLDKSETYGGRDASLSLTELHHFIINPPTGVTNLSAPVPISTESLRQSRDYAISLTPSILSATGPMIDTLVASGVARYVPFKLLDAVGLYDEAKAEVKMVPGSKEDVFKSKELGVLQKRKLMKFLMATASREASKSTETQNNDENFLDHLRGKNVGLDKEISNAIFYALVLSTDTNEKTESALSRLQKYIVSTGRHGNSPFLIGHFGGAGELAQGFCRTCAVSGGVYILGRPYTITYDPSQEPVQKVSEPTAPTSQDTEGIVDSEHPEPSQKDSKVENIPLNFHIQIDGIDDKLRARYVISVPDEIAKIDEKITDGSSAKSSKYDESQTIRLGRCIAIIEGPVYFKKKQPQEEKQDDVEEGEEVTEDTSKEGTETVPPPEDEGDGSVDSAILVFPPPIDVNKATLKHSEVVTAFVSGPSAMSCPDGKRIIYLTTTLSNDASPEQVLQPYLDALLHLNQPGEDASPLLASVFYAQISPSSSPATNLAKHTMSTESHKGHGTIDLRQPSYHLAEFGDRAAIEAERIFWEIIQDLGLDGRACARPKATETDDTKSSEPSVEEVDLVKRYWPPLILETDGSAW